MLAGLTARYSRGAAAARSAVARWCVYRLEAGWLAATAEYRTSRGPRDLPLPPRSAQVDPIGVCGLFPRSPPPPPPPAIVHSTPPARSAVSATLLPTAHAPPASPILPPPAPPSLSTPTSTTPHPSPPLSSSSSPHYSLFTQTIHPLIPAPLPTSSSITPTSPALPLTPTRTFVQLRTNLQVADNSGARRVQCIKVLRGRAPNAAGLGDVIIASVKDAEPRGKVRKGEVVTCVVVRAATHHKRKDGTEVRFDGPAAVVISKAGEPVGTRVFGPVPHELRARKMLKLLTLAQHVI
ncbi:unnamed protein product [Closterium sp. NIES-65]|nr:unnamed protein product [Closterium sp. NIES-65]